MATWPMAVQVVLASAASSHASLSYH
eukprot:SAG31_NODE_35268_length_324_cov_2.257778_1_plen_25_part_01